MKPVIPTYLDLMSRQTNETFALISKLSGEQIWRRPAPKEWSIGEILNHNQLMMKSNLAAIMFSWNLFHKRAKRLRTRPYASETENIYLRKRFPMWVGFLWRPIYSPKHPVPLATLKAETKEIHGQIRGFYTGEDEDILGNVYIIDPVFGRVNLIGMLRIEIYHDELHYKDVKKLAIAMKG
jgi:hypothetical protein